MRDKILIASVINIIQRMSLTPIDFNKYYNFFEGVKHSSNHELVYDLGIALKNADVKCKNCDELVKVEDTRTSINESLNEAKLTLHM